MKVRSDFVTNSSSSSFILAFSNKEMVDKLFEELPNYFSIATVNGIIEEIKNGEVTKDEAIEFYTEYISPYSWRFNGKSYWQLSEKEENSDEYKKFVEDQTLKSVTSFTEDLADNNFISIVEYEDHTEFGSKMEHEIMPNLTNTVRRISHH